MSEKYMFPQYELVTEKEECTDDDDITNTEEELKKFEALVMSGKAGTLQSEKDIDDDLLKMSNEVEDKTFTKFRKRIKNEPEQVLRYWSYVKKLCQKIIDQMSKLLILC